MGPLTPGASLFFFCCAVLPAASPPAAAERLDFRAGILPILTKAGCNGGACHGAAIGQGGFRLSLFGYDPEQDYLNITREASGRRVDLESPEASLLLKKPLRLISHRGGRRIQPDSPAHQTLLRWLAAGAPYGSRDLRVARVEAIPADVLLAAPGQTVELRVTATLSDGSRDDATALAVYGSNDDGIADVDVEGKVTARQPGLTSITVRYGGEVAAVRVAVPFDAPASDQGGAAGEALAAFTTRGFIDDLVARELRRLRLLPSPLSGDAEFLRRVHLDLAGRLPTPDEARHFLGQPLLGEPRSGSDRDLVVDRLLASDAFVDLWTLRFADLFLVGGRKSNEAIAASFHAWLRDQVARNVPFDRMAAALLTAKGDAKRVGPAGFLHLASDPRDLAEHASRMFLGIQLGCARCHAHPTDRWTREDHLGFAAYFARLGHDGEMASDAGRGEVEHPRTGRPVPPRPLPGSSAAAPVSPLISPPLSDVARRGALAAWLTSPENPLFAKAIVNRVWKHLLGRGLVEPADDLRPTNPPANPALLDALAADFIAGGYDVRRLIRTIAVSRTYQLSSLSASGAAASSRPPFESEQGDDRLFSRGIPKPLAAQVLLDAISQATGVPERFAAYPEGTRSVELASVETPSLALDVLGRCPRARSCEAPGRSAGGLAQALHLINGTTINSKLRGGAPALIEALQQSDRDAVSGLYLRTLSRFPDPDEAARWESLLAGASDRREALEDLLWALLNSREFAFNH